LIEKQMADWPRNTACAGGRRPVGLSSAPAIAAAVDRSGEEVEEHLDARRAVADRCGVEVGGRHLQRYRFRHPLYQQMWAERLAPRRRHACTATSARARRARRSLREIAAELRFTSTRPAMSPPVHTAWWRHNAIRRSDTAKRSIT
jgi:hypothetical protein